jgi:glycosyltransferase involved in cell wall biosynthesis
LEGGVSLPRVLVIAHNHPDLVPGGAEIAAHDLFRGLRAAGAEALYLGCATRLHRAPRPGSRLQTIGRSGAELLLWIGAHDRFLMSDLDPEPAVQAIGDVLGSFQPDVVHVHHLSRIGPEVVTIARRLRPKAAIVVTLHDYHPICFNDGLMVRPSDEHLCAAASEDACHACFPEIPPERFRLRRMHLLNGLAPVDRFIAPTGFLLERFVAWGLERRRVELIPNAVPSPAAQGKEPEPSLCRRFGFFGNIVPHKGVLVALEAARQLAAGGAELEIILNGGLQFPEPRFQRAFAAALAAAKGIVVHAGPYRRDQLDARMAEVGWVIVPSVWWENAPLVILEAFRRGRPVICSGIGGMAELVRDGVDGLHCRPRDPCALAAVLRRAAAAPELWAELRANLPKVQSVEDAVARHLRLYAALEPQAAAGQR